MNKYEYIAILEDFVGRRFDTVKELETVLTKKLNLEKKIKLDFSSINWERDFLADWNFCGSFEQDDIYCQFDIYFLYDREQNLYITEVGYEFELRRTKNEN